MLIQTILTRPIQKSALVLFHLRLLASVILTDDHKLSRLQFWNAAFVDGLRGRFDNAKARRWKPS